MLTVLYALIDPAGCALHQGRLPRSPVLMTSQNASKIVNVPLCMYMLFLPILTEFFVCQKYTGYYWITISQYAGHTPSSCVAGYKQVGALNDAVSDRIGTYSAFSRMMRRYERCELVGVRPLIARYRSLGSASVLVLDPSLHSLFFLSSAHAFTSGL